MLLFFLRRNKTLNVCSLEFRENKTISFRHALTLHLTVYTLFLQNAVLLTIAS